MNASSCGAMPGSALEVCEAIRRSGRQIPLLLSSSSQASRDNAYGASKRAAEEHVFALHREFGSPVAVYRLPGVFGKWARPNYNSVVATFCHNTVHGLPCLFTIGAELRARLHRRRRGRFHPTPGRGMAGWMASAE